jgi:hypothetical protein
MANKFDIGTDKKWFLGEDKILSFTIFAQDLTTPVDIGGWAIEFVLRKSVKTSSLVIPVKDTTNGLLLIVGVFNEVPASNTQRIHIPFPSDDTTLLKAGFEYQYSIKRTDEGNEGILVYGKLVFLQATAH